MVVLMYKKKKTENKSNLKEQMNDKFELYNHIRDKVLKKLKSEFTYIEYWMASIDACR